MADQNGSGQPPVPPQAPANQAEPVAPANPADKSFMDWSHLIVGILSALAGILGTPYGIYVAAGAAVLGIIGFFVGRSMYRDWKFKNDEAQAGSKTGGEASNDQQKTNDNRDDVDNFFGRDKRS